MKNPFLRTHIAAILGLIFVFQATESAPGAIIFFGLDNPRGTLTNSLQAEGDFLAALNSFGTDTVDTFADGALNPILIFGATGISAATSAAVGSLEADDDLLMAVSSPNYLLDGVGDDVFTLTAPVHAFGTFLIDLGTQDRISTEIVFVLENTLLSTSQTIVVGTFGPDPMGTADNNVAYFGIIDAANPFNRVTVHASFDGDFFGFDNLTVGFAHAPELTSFATWLGLCVAGMLVRRRV